MVDLGSWKPLGFGHCGDQGRVLRQEPSGTWIEEATPLSEDTILFGGWHNGTDVNLVVGGSHRRDGQQNIVLTRQQNGEWQQLSIPDPPEAFTFFKVWGENPTWIVRSAQRVLKLDASENHYFQTPTGWVLFTVHGHQQDVFAVGGQTRRRDVWSSRYGRGSSASEFQRRSEWHFRARRALAACRWI